MIAVLVALLSFAPVSQAPKDARVTVTVVDHVGRQQQHAPPAGSGSPGPPVLHQHARVDLLGGLSGEIDRQFTSWGLTAAEREIGILMLKGLRHKEIPLARNTTERTVRQQALAVYKKAGLDGRTDLAAYFLEDFLPPRAGADQPTKAAS